MGTSNRILMEDYVKAPNYNALYEIVQIYLNRYDEATTDAIPFFINAAEKAILREVRMPSMEKIVKFEMLPEDTEGWKTLPIDYVEMRHVWTTDSTGKTATLQRVTFDQILRGPVSVMGNTIAPANPTTDQTYMSCSGSQGGNWAGDSYTAGIWAITADRIYIKGVDVGQDLYMTYYKDIPELSSETQSNPLLELLPDAFLYQAVAEGWRFLMEYEKAQQWESSAAARVSQVTKQVEQADFAGSPLVITPGG